MNINAPYNEEIDSIFVIEGWLRQDIWLILEKWTAEGSKG